MGLQSLKKMGLGTVLPQQHLKNVTCEMVYSEAYLNHARFPLIMTVFFL